MAGRGNLVDYQHVMRLLRLPPSLRSGLKAHRNDNAGVMQSSRHIIQDNPRRRSNNRHKLHSRCTLEYQPVQFHCFSQNHPFNAWCFAPCRDRHPFHGHRRRPFHYRRPCHHQCPFHGRHPYHHHPYRICLPHWADWTRKERPL